VVVEQEPRWTGVFAFVGVVATYLLIVAGGLVTSSESGLAVVDWPNSFGNNMFLYPLARMSGGIFYEHAHRLLGSLVGLTTVALGIQIWMREKNRRGLKLFVLLAIFCVVVQGILGGLRVTGQPTLSTSPDDMSPSIGLAVVHGIFGQLFLGIMVSIAIMTSRKWLNAGAPAALPTVSTDRNLSILLGVVLTGQLVLGAVVRHLSWGLMAHIGLAVLVLVLAMLSGMRATGFYKEIPKLRKLGHAIVGIVSVQVLLGVIALFATGITPDPGPPSSANIILTTLHQAFGAFLLAHVAMLMCWLYRLVTPKREGTSS
jgi:cytochrome c oxidase assembly protein subunit 15